MGQIVLGQLLPIGSVIHSMLTESQFQAEMGSGWVLSDGRNIAGSRYATLTGASTIPDVRGAYLRIKNNGRADGKQNPDGDLELGTYTNSKVEGHAHQQYYSTNGQNRFGYTINDGVNVYTPSVNCPPSTGHSGPNSTSSPGAFNTGNYGSNETAPKSITVNAFIRIN